MSEDERPFSREEFIETLQNSWLPFARNIREDYGFLTAYKERFKFKDLFEIIATLAGVMEFTQTTVTALLHIAEEAPSVIPDFDQRRKEDISRFRKKYHEYPSMEEEYGNQVQALIKLISELPDEKFESESIYDVLFEALIVYSNDHSI